MLRATGLIPRQIQKHSVSCAGLREENKYRRAKPSISTSRTALLWAWNSPKRGNTADPKGCRRAPLQGLQASDHPHKQSFCSISFCPPCSAGVAGCGIAPQTRVKLILLTSHSLHGDMQRLANMQQSKWHLLLYLPSSADRAYDGSFGMLVVCRPVTFTLGPMALSHHNSQLSPVGSMAQCPGALKQPILWYTF